MSDYQNRTIEDLSFEHSQHFTWTAHCSSCYREDRFISAHKLVNGKESSNHIERESFNRGLNNWGERDFGSLN